MKKYYKVSMTKKINLKEEDCYTIVGKYIVNNMDELKKIVEDTASDEGGTVDDFDITYEESTIEEFIKHEENDFKRYLINIYIDRHPDEYGNITVRQYNQLRRCLDDDFYYKILREENRAHHLGSIIHNIADIKKITLYEYENLIKDLLKADSQEKYDNLLKKYAAK